MAIRTTTSARTECCPFIIFCQLLVYYFLHPLSKAIVLSEFLLSSTIGSYIGKQMAGSWEKAKMIDTTSEAVAEAPAEKPFAGAESRKSKSASSELAPAGISVWIENISTRSRRHEIALPAAINFSPATWMIGPSGMCSPGIHSG